MKNANSLIKVAEWLEDGAKHVTVGDHKIGRFDMEHTVSYESCGTACCIAGAIVQFEGLLDPVVKGEAEFFDPDTGVGPLAADHLGLSQEQAESLFVPWEYFDNDTMSEFSDPQRAAKVLRHFISTGNIDWDQFPPSPDFVLFEE